MAKARVGYLGPEGSFAHEAVSLLENMEAVACPSIADVLSAVSDGSLEWGLLPLENAIEGTVSATIDGLVFDHDLLIEREIVIPIRLHLLARPGVELDQVTKVLSYVHALAPVSYTHLTGDVVIMERDPSIELATMVLTIA